jgi:hypothetical protein
LVTKTVTAGRPTLVARTRERGSGVDPLALTITYGRTAIGATAYDPETGVAVFPLPAAAPALRAGSRSITLISGDFQEDKNVDQAGEISTILPNTRFVPVKLKVVRGPTIAWVDPQPGACAATRTRLVAVASATKSIRSVRFFVDGKRIATVRRGATGLYRADWRPKGLARGSHMLQAIVTDEAGATAEAFRGMKICRQQAE